MRFHKKIIDGATLFSDFQTIISVLSLLIDLAYARDELFLTKYFDQTPTCKIKVLSFLKIKSIFIAELIQLLLNDMMTNIRVTKQFFFSPHTEFLNHVIELSFMHIDM